MIQRLIRSRLGRLVICLGWLGLFAWRPGLAQEAPGLNLDLVRFQAEGSQTILDGYIHIPLRILRLAPIQEGYRCALSLNVTLYDTIGVQIYTNTWTRVEVVPDEAVAASADAYLIETFAVLVTPGRYRVHLSVKDSLAGREITQETEASSLSDLRLSDVLLASRIERDTTRAEGYDPRRKHGLFILPNPSLTFSRVRQLVWFYYEVYSGSSDGKPHTMQVTLRIRDEDGEPVQELPSRRVHFTGEAGMDAGAFSVAGLEPGRFQVELEARDAESGEVIGRQSKLFTVIPGVQPARPPEASRPAKANPWGGLSQAEADSLFDSLRYFVTLREKKFYEGLTLEAKRAFLWDFLRKRDPNPETEVNEFLEEFERRFQYANEHFTSKARLFDGWLTDRGRIYITLGPPADVVQRPFEVGAEPYEIWLYTTYRYAFYDEGRGGRYRLIYTNDPNMATPPGWERFLPRKVVEDILGMPGLP